MKRISIPFEDDERRALIALAIREKRDSRLQAAILVRWQLEAMGLLEAEAGPARPPIVPPIVAANLEVHRNERPTNP